MIPKRFALVGLMAALLGAGPTFAQASRALRAADAQPGDHPTVQALEHFARLVERETGGRFRVKVFPARQLGEEKETIEQTRLGAIDVNRINAAHLTEELPEAAVLALPFLFRSTEHLHRTLDGPVGAEVLASLERTGLVGLAYLDAGARFVYTTRPLRVPGDLSSLRLRVQQSEQMAALARALGAEPVTLPYGQALTALRTGLVDGAENNWPSYVAAGHHAAAPYVALTEHTMAPELLVMSRKLWITLDARDREAFRRAAGEAAARAREAWRTAEEQARQTAEAAGVQVVRPDRDRLRARTEPLHGRLARDAAARGLADRVRAMP